MSEATKKADELAITCMRKKATLMDWIKDNPAAAGAIGGAGLGGIYSLLDGEDDKNKSISERLRPILLGAIGGGSLGGAYSVGKGFLFDKDKPDSAVGGKNLPISAKQRHKQRTKAIEAVAGGAALAAVGPPAVKTSIKTIKQIRKRLSSHGFVEASLSNKDISNMLKMAPEGIANNPGVLRTFVDNYAELMRDMPRTIRDRLHGHIPVPSSDRVTGAAVKSVFGARRSGKQLQEWLEGMAVGKLGKSIPVKLWENSDFVKDLSSLLAAQKTTTGDLFAFLKGYGVQINNPQARAKLADLLFDSFHVSRGNALRPLVAHTVGEDTLHGRLQRLSKTVPEAPIGSFWKRLGRRSGIGAAIAAPMAYEIWNGSSDMLNEEQ